MSTGHNAVATDLSGQDWLVSHAIDRAAPCVAGRESARHLVITRLDWIGGWPVGDGGKGIPDEPRPGPRTDATLADAFEDGPDAELAAWETGEGWERRRTCPMNPAWRCPAWSMPAACSPPRSASCRRSSRR